MASLHACALTYRPVASQEPVLFNRTIAENIAFGVEPPPTRSDIEEAARVANAHDFIIKLPEVSYSSPLLMRFHHDL